MSGFMSIATRYANRLLMKAIKVSPTVMVTIGVGGVVAGTVMACKATTKAQTELKDDIQEIANIRAAYTDPETNKIIEVERKEYGEKILPAYVNLGMKAAKIYAPSITVTALSLTSIVFSHRMLCKRNVGLAAAYAALDHGFKEYRARVKEELGTEVEQKFRYGFKDEVVEVDTDDGNGGTVKETKIVHSVEVPDGPGCERYSIYARFFDETSTEWEKDPEYNLSFLHGCEQMANAKLRTQGYLFLNDVYQMLGLERSNVGQVVGWIYDPSDPTRDNYVDFNIYPDIARKANRAFVNGYERSILLDFNVDGDILSEM